VSRSALYCLWAFPFAALAAQAPDPHAAQPERPTVATHAGTVTPGWLELETGLEYDRFRDATHAYGFPLLFKLGVAPRVQLSIALPFAKPEGVGVGPGDYAVGVKLRLLGHGFLGRFAVFPALKVPTGSTAAGRGSGTTDVSLLLISSHQLGPVSMDLNAGVTRRSGDGTAMPKTSTVWTASFGGPAAGALGWVFEVFGYPKTTGPAGSASTVAVLAGPTYRIASWLVIDAGGILRLAGEQPKAVYAGLTWNVGRYWGSGRKK